MSKHVPAEVFSPGDFIRDELKARGWTQEDLANILGRPLPAVSEIIQGKRGVTPLTARELAEAFGTSAEYWLNLESIYRLSSVAGPGGAVSRRAELYSIAPIKEMERRHWIKRTISPEELEAELKCFYGVKSLKERPRVRFAARQSGQQTDEIVAAQTAWCHRAHQVAQLVAAGRFTKTHLMGAIEALQQCMYDPEGVRHAPLVLARAGIRLVIVEHLSRTRIDGAALWLSASKPVVALSMRYARIDYFWFTLLHELAHILNCDGEVGDPDIFTDSEVLDKKEKKANRQAAAWLIAPEKLESFILRTTPLYSATKIRNFAKRMRVNPSIVVGQLKFKRELAWTHHNRLQKDNVRRIIQEAAMCDGWGRIAPV